jgi:hypothetical protein
MARITADYSENSTNIETLSLIDDALVKLSEQDRSVVILRYAQGLTIKETALALNITESAAERRASRALDRLRRHCAAPLTITALAAIFALEGGGVDAAPISVFNISNFRTQQIYQGAVKHMAITKLKIAAGILGASAIIGTSGFAVIKAQEKPTRPPAKVSAAVKMPENPLLSSLMLPDGFTLKYAVTAQTLQRQLSQEERDQYLKWRTGLENDQVKSGSISREQADKDIKQFEENSKVSHRDASPKTKEEVTISVLNGKLYYQKSGQYMLPNTDNDHRQVFSVKIYDGSMTFTYNKGKRIYGSGFQKVFQVGDYYPFVVPGIGFSHVPIFEGDTRATFSPDGSQTLKGKILGINYAQNGKIDGEVNFKMVKGKPQVLSTVDRYHEHISAKWEFHGHKLLKGRWIASSMTWTSYAADEEPDTRVDCTLLSASDKPLPPELFEAVHWINPGEEVRYLDQTVEPADNMSFIYDPTKGTLDRQINATRIKYQEWNRKRLK